MRRITEKDLERLVDIINELLNAPNEPWVYVDERSPNR